MVKAFHWKFSYLFSPLYHLSCQSLFLMEINQWIHHCCFFAFQSSNSMRLSNWWCEILIPPGNFFLQCFYPSLIFFWEILFIINSHFVIYQPPFLLPSHPIPLGCPRALALGALWSLKLVWKWDLLPVESWDNWSSIQTLIAAMKRLSDFSVPS